MLPPRALSAKIAKREKKSSIFKKHNGVVEIYPQSSLQSIIDQSLTFHGYIRKMNDIRLEKWIPLRVPD